jgi:hypothetical protein
VETLPETGTRSHGVEDPSDKVVELLVLGEGLRGKRTTAISVRDRDRLGGAADIYARRGRTRGQ